MFLFSLQSIMAILFNAPKIALFLFSLQSTMAILFNIKKISLFLFSLQYIMAILFNAPKIALFLFSLQSIMAILFNTPKISLFLFSLQSTMAILFNTPKTHCFSSHYNLQWQSFFLPGWVSQPVLLPQSSNRSSVTLALLRGATLCSRARSQEVQGPPSPGLERASSYKWDPSTRYRPNFCYLSAMIFHVIEKSFLAEPAFINVLKLLSLPGYS